MEERKLHGDVERTLADRLLREAGTAVLGHLVLLGIVMALVWDALPATVAAAWASAVVAATFARLLLWRRARILRLSPRTALATVRATMIALGLAWSLGTAVAVRYLPLVTILLIVMGLTGLLAGAVASLAADRWVFKLYLGALFGPAMAGLPFAGHRPENATLVLILVFAAFMWREHERAYRTLLEGLRTEQRLRDRERQLGEAQAIAHVGSWEQDIAANRVTWSDEAYRLYGVPLGSPVGYEVFVARLHPDDRARVERVVADGLAQRRPVEYEFRIVRPDGAVHARTDKQRLERIVGNLVENAVVHGGADVRVEVRRDGDRVAIVVSDRGPGIPVERVLTDEGSWEQFESYVRGHGDVEFSHGICPDCARKWAADV